MIPIKDITITRRPNPAFDSIRMIASINWSYEIQTPADSLPLKSHVNRDRDVLNEITRGLCATVYRDVAKELQKIIEVAVKESGEPYSYSRDTINALWDLRAKLSRPQV